MVDYHNDSNVRIYSTWQALKLVIATIIFADLYCQFKDLAEVSLLYGIPLPSSPIALSMLGCLSKARPG